MITREGIGEENDLGGYWLIFDHLEPPPFGQEPGEGRERIRELLRTKRLFLREGLCCRPAGLLAR